MKDSIEPILIWKGYSKPLDASVTFHLLHTCEATEDTSAHLHIGFLVSSSNGSHPLHKGELIIAKKDLTNPSTPIAMLSTVEGAILEEIAIQLAEDLETAKWEQNKEGYVCH